MRYESPATLDDAIALLQAEPGSARILAGGTDILVQLRSGAAEPDLIVDIKRIDGICDIAEEEGGFRIGAAVSGAMLDEHAGVKAAWPGVVEAACLVGSVQVHARATLAGNLCNASPAADTIPAMIAAGAVARIHGPNGTRDIPVERVPTGPGQTSLEKGEVIGSIFLPVRPTRAGDAYLRFIPRTEMDIAVAGAAVSVSLDGNTIAEARVALGAVAPTALPVEEAAAILKGSNAMPDETTLDRLAAAASAACNPIDDKRGTIEFRTDVAGVLVRRAAGIALARAKGEA